MNNKSSKKMKFNYKNEVLEKAGVQFGRQIARESEIDESKRSAKEKVDSEKVMKRVRQWGDRVWHKNATLVRARESFCPHGG